MDLRSGFWAVATAALVLAGCPAAPQAQAPSSKSPASGPASAPASATATVDAAKKRARTAAKTLGRRLKKRVLKAMADGGPPGAIGACADDARLITRAVQDETGVRLGRASLRLRNPDNHGPDWVKTWLQTTGERAFQGVKPHLSVATSTAGQVVQLIVPLPIGGMCLQCHGPAERIDPGVKALLTKRYPHDAALGYEDGDLRGVIWAEAPVTR